MKGLKLALTMAIAIGLLAGTAVGVAAQDGAADPLAPSRFTGELQQPEISEDPDTGHVVLVAPFKANDPRASGTLTAFIDSAVVEGDKRDYRVQSNSVRLVNDGGAWVGTSLYITSKKLPNGNDVGGTFQQLTGEGDYEGLSMFIYSTSGSKGGAVERGFIVPTDIVPAFPEPPAAE